jgi:aryl-alcohol dehydrogenase-like predicted oxidoreductase
MKRPTAGRATGTGTTRYEHRLRDAADDHFASCVDLRLSSVALGTHLGSCDDSTDWSYEAAIRTALTLGCNVVDTAPNYRCGRSERTIGRTLMAMLAEGTIARDEVCISTKAGFIPIDETPARLARRYQLEVLRDADIVSDHQIYKGHVLSPKYVKFQLGRSLEALQLETIDVFLLHNPDTQLERLGERAFHAVLQQCFAELELAVADGLITTYGISTWEGFRERPAAGGSLDLMRLLRSAEEVAGPDHHLRAIQLPINLGMTGAIARRSGSDNRSVMQVAIDCGIAVFASGPLRQGRLSHLPEECAQLIPGGRTDAQRALQFARSIAGVTSAIAGMRDVAHVRENLELRRSPRMTPTEMDALFAET